jgi:DNA-binding CsgD family transcriptional regulator
MVIAANAAADRLFDRDIRISNRRLAVRDRTASRELAALLDQLAALLDRLRVAPETAAMAAPPIMIRRESGRGVVARALPVSGAARGPFLGARALLILSDMGERRPACAKTLSRAFGLTPAEARLAVLIADGRSLDEAAGRIGIKSQTGRNQLKAIFAKTGTHRQAELVALLSRLPGLWPPA